jgi:hypothetical protein
MSKYKHPVTGEPITLGEHLSWKIQFAIRRWMFIGAITFITITCWVFGTRDANVLVWWNLFASYMALFIESVVGMAMFNMAQNDGRVIRKILKLELNQFEDLKQLISELETEHHIVEEPK